MRQSRPQVDIIIVTLWWYGCEISLRPFTFCNLTEINAGTVKSQEDFDERVKVAAFFGTLQAGFSDFHYLRSKWKQNTEKDALVGVGITGIGNNTLADINLKKSAKIAKDENALISNMIDINPAARVTTIKPSGTSSCVLGTSSGIHAWHAEYYIRNMQCKVGDDLYNYFNKNYPKLIKIMDYMPDSAVIGIPQKAPENAILREKQSALMFLDLVRKFNLDWVKEGHNSGPNTNNVSATVNVKDDEWKEVGEWMWNNKDSYNGLSVLPFDGGTYKDAPFMDIEKEKYEELSQYIKDNPIDLTLIKEEVDNTDLKGEIACAGGACDLSF
jgi:ribonucleoside-diphosphate reductase alpha chain